MFNVGGPEVVVILLVALLVLGPEQLPKAMRTFGNVMGEVRKVSSGFQDEMRSVMDTMEATGSESSTRTQTGKPHSPKPPSGAPGDAGVESDAAAIDDAAPEVVARNTAVGDDPASAASNGSGRPPLDPADRAAG